MQQKNVAPNLCDLSSDHWDPVPDIPVPAALEVEFDPALNPIIEHEPSIPTAEPEAPVAKKKRGGQAALRSELLGENSKEARSRIRENLPQGFEICLSGKRSIGTVLRLSACCALPDVDFLGWSHSCTDMSMSSEYDVIYNMLTSRGCFLNVVERHRVFLLHN